MNIYHNFYYLGKIEGKWQILYSNELKDLSGPLQNDNPIDDSQVEKLVPLCYVNQQTGDINIHNSVILLENFKQKLLKIFPK